jgi:copper(I)-binding protein
MKEKPMLRSTFVIGLLLLASVAPAVPQTKAIEVTQAWARATPGGAKTAALYMTLVNKGSAEDRLVSVSTPVAGKAEVHSSTTENGVMHMGPVAALAVKPGTPTILKPGGYHVMLTDLKAPLVAGQTFTVSLTFEKAGTIEATATVQKVGAMGPGAMPGMQM